MYGFVDCCVLVIEFFELEVVVCDSDGEGVWCVVFVWFEEVVVVWFNFECCEVVVGNE